MISLCRKDCPILTLVLKKKWYDLIASGEKKEEYRDVTQIYVARFRNFQRKLSELNIDIFGRCSNGKGCAVAAFSLGYKKADLFRTIRFTLADGDNEATLPGGGAYWAAAAIREHAFHPEWGEPDCPHYVIGLGDPVELVDE